MAKGRNRRGKDVSATGSIFSMKDGTSGIAGL